MAGMDIPTASLANRPARKSHYLVWALVLAAIGLALFWTLRTAPASAADPAATEHRQDGIAIQWTIAQYPAAVLKNNPFTLRLQDASGNLVEGAMIDVKMEMLDMVCGDYVFELRETSPGVYEGSGVPLMPGLWRATATMRTASGESFTVDRTLKAVY
ncbi:hypothetical protein RB620_19395 [Paenibacillus sp. LHD-117]|uniref:hypothetical protein n=1 Tax=Paenibacillus sp. LHD-117 TaxID=3071412 RepID=UPI0027DF5490|nr:hypothetical protein [Paenibacillus sp. LHD-117]MDQ6421595.1 hypothetical protein [Paenibacillus sp. LHD-117]